MDPRFERNSFSIEDTHWWYRGRRRVVAALISQLDIPRGARILDAGCGSGRNMVELAALGEVSGVEVAAESVERARARGVGEVVQGRLESLPWDAGSFDLVVCLDVLEHIEDDAAALRELHRVAKPGARLVVSVPAHPWLWSSHDEMCHHQRRYTRASLLGVAAASGWSAERVTGFNAGLLPAVAAYRALDRFRRSPRPDGADFEATPRWANVFLEALLRAEAAGVRRGRNLPVGVSAMAVLRAEERRSMLAA